MNLSEIYKKNNAPPKKKKLILSLEVFPPKDNLKEKTTNLINELKILNEFNPNLISITYGAGGTTKQNTIELAKRIETEVKTDVMPHFTCINSTKDFIEKYIKDIEALGIRNILALRGDIPQNEKLTNSDFKHANELVEFIKDKTNLSIGVAGYPESHTEAKNLKEDVLNLKKKIDAGAQVIYTQLFFNNNSFYKFVELVRAEGINVPIIPGILPITSFSQITKMTSLCGVKIPQCLKEKLIANQNDIKALKEIGSEFAIKQTSELIKFGVSALHFYILNKSEPIYTILKSIL